MKYSKIICKIIALNLQFNLTPLAITNYEDEIFKVICMQRFYM